jgi:hypothetical protein
MQILSSGALQLSTVFLKVRLAIDFQKQSRADRKTKSMNFLLTEEGVIVQHILDLDARGFPSWLAAVKDMAGSLLAECHCNPVGQN